MALTRIDLLPREDPIHMLKHDIKYSKALQWIFHNLSQGSDGRVVGEKGEFYRTVEFSCPVLNRSLKPPFVSAQPPQSLTLEPPTLSRVLQPPFVNAQMAQKAAPLII